MASAATESGISPEDLRKLRYQCVVNREGKRILIQVVEWSYRGGTLTVRQTLFLDPNFSGVRYRSVFNAHQRALLDAGKPLTDFDITLLYQVLRRVCGLNPNDDAWTTEGPTGPSLEHMIYKVKLHRNNLAHEDFSISQSEMEEKLEEMRLLFLGIIKEAGCRFSRTDDEVENLLRDTNERIDQMYTKIREPLEADDIAQYQQEVKEMREQLGSSIKEAAKEELDQLYTRLCEINILPWILMDLQVNPTQIFTKFRLKESVPNADQKPLSIPHDGILEVRKSDGSMADVLIISGDGGMGKTTFLKYLTEVWVKEPSAVPGLDQVELLFYIECRNPSIDSFDQLTKSLLHETHRKVNVEFDHVRETVLHMQILILIDGFDEVNDASRKVIREALHLPATNVRIIFTTRPGSLFSLYSLLPHHRRKLDLSLEGITQEHHSEFVNRLCDSFVSDDDRRNQIKMAVDEHLQTLDECLGTHLNNPLNLTLFTMLFIQDPSVMTSLNTATDLYTLLTKLVSEKLAERILLKISNPDVEYKISQFVEFNDSLSLRAMQRREYELLPGTVQNIRTKCHELGLPFDEIMAAFFTVRRSRSAGFFNVLTYSYHHLRLQEFFSARHLYRNITETMDLEHTVNTYLAAAEEWNSEDRFQNLMIHLTGLLTSHPDILYLHSSKLLNLVNIRSTCADPVLAHINESKLHPAMVNAAVAKLGEHCQKWDGWIQVKHPSSLRVLSTVLHGMASTIKVMALTVYSRSSTDEHLVSAFRTLSQKEIRLVLDMYSFYFSSREIALTGDTFRLLLPPGGACLLEGIRGRLSTAALALLPSCIKEMRLRVTLEEANLLSSIIPRLKNLEILGLKYIEEEKHDPGKLSQLPFEGRKLSLTLSLPLKNCEADVEWAVAILSTFCSLRKERNCASIYIADAHLRRDGIEKMLQLLHAEGVSVTQRLDLQLRERLKREDHKKVEELAVALNVGSLIVHYFTS